MKYVFTSKRLNRNKNKYYIINVFLRNKHCCPEIYVSQILYLLKEYYIFVKTLLDNKIITEQEIKLIVPGYKYSYFTPYGHKLETTDNNLYFEYDDMNDSLIINKLNIIYHEFDYLNENIFDKLDLLSLDFFNFTKESKEVDVKEQSVEFKIYMTKNAFDNTSLEYLCLSISKQLDTYDVFGIEPRIDIYKARDNVNMNLSRILKNDTYIIVFQLNKA